mmetsp:Transcript_8886/g.23029  ORF Transcript_8886/g.23029 Transcript_8886/m.23029 type:complete len:202 (-) Transcript_8886:311-916(-)
MRQGAAQRVPSAPGCRGGRAQKSCGRLHHCHCHARAWPRRGSSSARRRERHVRQGRRYRRCSHSCRHLPRPPEAPQHASAEAATRTAPMEPQTGAPEALAGAPLAQAARALVAVLGLAAAEQREPLRSPCSAAAGPPVAPPPGRRRARLSLFVVRPVPTLPCACAPPKSTLAILPCHGRRCRDFLCLGQRWAPPSWSACRH